MAIKEERKGNLSRGLVFGIFALLWEIQTVWINVWGNTVLCPKSAIPHLGWKLNGNSKCWSCKSCEPCFLLCSLVPFGAAKEELAGQLASFSPSLLPFLSTSLHSPFATDSPGAGLGGASTSSHYQGWEGCRLKINQNLICALLGYAHT